MSDSPFEEMEAHEHAEHAEHAAHENDPLLSRVTLTIAIMAVIAARYDPFTPRSRSYCSAVCTF